MLERLLITKCEPFVWTIHRARDDDVRRSRVQNNGHLMRFLSMVRNRRQQPQFDRTFLLADRKMPTNSNDATRRTLVLHQSLSLLTPRTQKEPISRNSAARRRREREKRIVKEEEEEKKNSLSLISFLIILVLLLLFLLRASCKGYEWCSE